jgi:hypothetical protein
MYVNVNLSKPAGISPGTGSGKNRVVIVDADDVLVYPPRDDKGVKMQGTFVLKDNARMLELYTTKSKGEAPVESDGDEDSINIKQMFKCQHPGNSLEVKEFIQNWLGRNVYVLHTACADNFIEVMGTPCAPLQVKPAKTDSNDARFWTLNFEAYASSQYVPGHYEGDLIFEAPATVADAEAIAIDTEVNSQYKLPATSATTEIAIASVDANHGDIVTLIGKGGTTAATLAQLLTGSTLIVLKNGATWTALEDSVIHLQVYKAGATTILSELSRA